MVCRCSTMSISDLYPLRQYGKAFLLKIVVVGQDVSDFVGFHWPYPEVSIIGW